MTLLRSLVFRLRALFGRDRMEVELDEEIRFHVELETEKLVREEGLDPHEARRRALVAFGGVEQAKERAREARGVRWLEDMGKDVRFALRSFVRKPVVAVAAVVTLALGIGGNAALFGVVDSLLLQPPSGVAAPDGVVRLLIERRTGTVRTPGGGAGSGPDFRALREGTRGVQGVAAFLRAGDMDLNRGPDAQRVRGRGVSGEFFTLLGVRPALGRVLLPSDDGPGEARASALLSHGFWRREFGGDPDVVGRSISLNGERFTVVGVAAPEFTGIDANPVNVWIPLGARVSADRMGDAHSVFVRFLTRISPDASRERVVASAEAALAGAAGEYADLDPEPGVIAAPLNALRRPGGPAPLAAILFAAATGFVLLIACANVANLLLARAVARRRELAVRLSLGAGAGRMMRQLLTESVLLALAGGAAGLLIAVWAGGLVRRFPVPPGVGQPDLRLLGFTFALALGTGVVFGLAPAIRAARTRLLPALKDTASVPSASRGRLRRTLVVAQVALSLVLLVAAAIAVRSLRTVVTVDTGVDLDRVLVASVDLGSAGYDGPERDAFYDRAIERVRGMPEVESAAVALIQPLSGSGWGIGVGGLDTRSAGIREGPYANIVGVDFFRTTGTPVLRGRGFGPRDVRGAEPVAVLNERLAEALASGGDVVGRCVPLGEQVEAGGCTRIVGVAANTRHRYLDDVPPPKVFFPRTQRPVGERGFFTSTVLVRTHGEAGDAASVVRRAMQGLAPDLPYVEVQRMEATLGSVLRPFRVLAALFTTLGLLALALAAVGLYAVLAYATTERTREVGLRKALGARDREVVGLVVRRGMGTTAIGLAIGLAGAVALTRVLYARVSTVPMLNGVVPNDAWTFVIAAGGLAVVALFASYLPARRAARVDPMTALRTD